MDSVFTVLDYSDATSVSGAEAVYFYNKDISSGIPIPGEGSPKTVENGDKFHGAVVDENGHIDVYTNVDYFIGGADDDTFLSVEMDLINSMLCGQMTKVIPLTVEAVKTH